MLENSLIGAYWYSLYDFGEKHNPFSCNGRIRANSAAKELHIRNINTKEGPPNRHTGLPLNSSFFNCQNDHHLGAAIAFDCVSSPPPLTLLKSTNDSL